MQKEITVEVDGLTVHYNQVPVLWDIHFAIPRGSFVGILGPNGAGKSTLLKSMLGLVPIVSGSIWMEGKPFDEMRSRVAYVPQRSAVDWSFPISVLQLVLMGCFPKSGPFGRVTKEDRKRALSCLEQVGIKDLAERQISELSGGQQQRAFLARALLQEADIYLLDEPLAGVDHATEEIIIGLLSKIAKEKTVLMVHHDLGSVEQYFNYILLLNISLIASGAREEVFTKQNIQKAYGKNFALFDETVKISQQKAAGMK